MSASNAQYTSAHTAASDVRPRPNRLISGLDEGDETTYDATIAPFRRIASPLPSPFDSRSASPIPPAHPQRSPRERRRDPNASASSPSRANAGRQRTTEASLAPSLSALWGSSWTALQGIASDLLGSDIATDNTRVRRPLSKTRSAQRVTSAPSTKWGPQAPKSASNVRSIGAGTKEQQTADFRARKRKDMLMGQESSYADSLGKFKRRLSDDRTTASAPPAGNEDRDALVYLHHVKKEDTLAGITIKYNISANALRKANRMWPNDTVQIKQTLVLPVDACGTKGRPFTEAVEDLLGSESDALSTLHAVEVPPSPAINPTTQVNGNPAHHRSRTNSSSAQTVSSALASIAVSDAPWHHDSWVLFPGHDEPTEIARLARRALGYFPPARRKSNGFSDTDTPSTSLDLARTKVNEANQDKPGSPARSKAARRERRLSNANNGYFPSYMSGPGGVGTMSKSVHSPGPGQDGLNKIFAKHLPDVAPPRNQKQLYQPGVPLYTDEPTPTVSGATTPAYPTSHGPNMNMNLENLGGNIESWVRKLATKAVQTPRERQQAARASVGAPGKGAGGIGDLIEMTNDFEIGDDEEEEEESRGRQGSPSKESSMQGSSATSYVDNAASRRTIPGPASKSGKSGKAD